jgi:hypothetical protein
MSLITSAAVANPDLAVRSSGTVCNVALYRSARPDRQIKIHYWPVFVRTRAHTHTECVPLLAVSVL